jgi:hypothetical protein
MTQTLAPPVEEAPVSCPACANLAVLLGAPLDACYHRTDDDWETGAPGPGRWPRRRVDRDRLRRLSATAAVLLLTGFVAGFGTLAAFSGVTESKSNTFGAGTVELASNDAGSRMFEVENMKPGQVEEQCIVVSFVGTLQSTVRMYGISGGDGLADHLHATVWRAPAPVDPVPFADCPTEGPGLQLYSGTVAALPGIYDLGFGGVLLWEPQDAHVYRIRVELPAEANGAEVQGLSATLQMVWEARNT